MERVQDQAPRGSQPSILIVDDDMDTHDALAELLEHAGFSVVWACNGREALTKLASMRPSMILLDVEMPVMNGAEFRQAQRRSQELIGIPTVVMTGSREEPMLDPGVAHVLRKPFRSAQLIETVRRFATPVTPASAS
jgi:CheY-like chemotaxis protein